MPRRLKFAYAFGYIHIVLVNVGWGAQAEAAVGLELLYTLAQDGLVWGYGQ